MKKLLVILALAFYCGCSNSPTVEYASTDDPLTIAQWKELEAEEKYAPETLQRLRNCDPKLEDEANWDQFMTDVVVPERRHDIPTDY